MGILDAINSQIGNTSSNGVRRTGGAVQDRPQAKIWLNIGYEKNGKFVNLPVGIPVDTMEPAVIRGQNEDWNKFQSARNNLLKALQQVGDELEPGAEIEVPNLVIRVRRTNEAMSINDSDNEYSTDLGELFNVPAK